MNPMYVLFGALLLGASGGLFSSLDATNRPVFTGTALVTEKYGTESFPYQACFYLEQVKETSCASFSGETWSGLKVGERITIRYSFGRWTGNAFIA